MYGFALASTLFVFILSTFVESLIPLQCVRPSQREGFRFNFFQTQIRETYELMLQILIRVRGLGFRV
jgi:hypothetical protein